MVNNQLKKVLDDKKLSFSDLKKLLETKEIKINNSQLSLYSRGKRKPKNKKMWIDIAEVLQVDLQEIITDINYYLSIMNEISENSTEKKDKTENEKTNDSLFQELLSLVDKNSPSELEKVYRYCSLVSNFENLSKAIDKAGVMILVSSGENEIKKPHPAIAEKVKVNAALIKLDEFFEEKRTSKPKNSSEKDWSKFTK